MVTQKIDINWGGDVVKTFYVCSQADNNVASIVRIQAPTEEEIIKAMEYHFILCEFYVFEMIGAGVLFRTQLGKNTPMGKG